MRRLGMPVSDTTILRSLKEHARARSDNGAVHVAGIDDWAWRKGTNYGTIIVDLERHQVVDLLGVFLNLCDGRDHCGLLALGNHTRIWRRAP